jgi:hypothetical protein
MVVPFEGRGIVEEIRRFLEKGVAAQHESDGMVRLQIEMLCKGLSSGKPLLAPSLECVFVGLEVEKRKPVSGTA